MYQRLLIYSDMQMCVLVYVGMCISCIVYLYLIQFIDAWGPGRAGPRGESAHL